MKIVCVTQRLIYDKITNTFKDGLDKDLTVFLNKLGYMIIPIPNLHFTELEFMQMIKIYVHKLKICGFILSGGEDIGVNLNRDRIERRIIVFCQKKKFPLVGICRGLQIIAKFNKIKLIKISNHVRTRHKVYQTKTKQFKKVNSFHNWGFKNCPKNFISTYITKDKFIESIEHHNLPIKAMMWHPERERKYSTEDKKIFLNTLK